MDHLACRTCGGLGLIGGHSGQTPDSYEEYGEPCPDCIMDRQEPAMKRNDIISALELAYRSVGAKLDWQAENDLRAILISARNDAAALLEDAESLDWLERTFRVVHSKYTDDYLVLSGEVKTPESLRHQEQRITLRALANCAMIPSGELPNDTKEPQ